MINQTLEERFKDYIQSVYPNHIIMPANQAKELRNAFFGGMIDMFSILTDEVSELSEDEAMVQMNKIKDQIDIFIEQIVSEQNKN